MDHHQQLQHQLHLHIESIRLHLQQFRSIWRLLWIFRLDVTQYHYLTRGAPERFKVKSNSRQKFDCGAGILGTSMSSPFWIFEFPVPVLEAIADDPVFVHVLGKHISEKKTKDENKKTPDGEDIDGRGYSCLPFIIFSWFLKRMSCNNFCSWDWSWKAPSDNMPQHFFSISFPNSKYSLNWPLTCQITLKSTNSKLTKYSLLFDRKKVRN